MEAKYTPADLKIELASIGFQFRDKIEIPTISYEFIVDRLMQSELYDRQNENFISVLIFHTLAKTYKTFKDPQALESMLRDDLFEVAVTMTKKIFALDVLNDLGQEPPHPPEYDPHNPITGTNTIPRTSSLDLGLKPPEAP